MNCKNCDAPVQGKFCQNCGQKRDTNPITFKSMIRQALNTVTDLDKGFLYNLAYLSIDFKATVLGYLDGKRIRVYNPISYAIIGVSLLLLAGEQFKNIVDFGSPGGMAQSEFYGYGFSYGTFIGEFIKYTWLLGIFAFAIPASLFYKQRRFTEHMAIQAFIIGHSSYIALLFYPILAIKIPANPLLLFSMLALNIWVYWKMDRDLWSPLFSPIIFILGFIILLLLPIPAHFAYTKIKNKPLKQEVISEGLRHPWSVAFLNEEEVLVTEKDAGIKRINLTSGLQTEIRGLPQDLADSIRVVDPRDNAGLFEILLDPDFVTIPWVYLSYAAKGVNGTTTKVIRAQLHSDSLTQIQTLLYIEPSGPDRFHYGGGMVMGADNKLYITIGERFYNETDQPILPVAQDIKDARGMIYRINRDGSIPSDNPDFGSNAVPGVYAIGIRAAQGLTIHPESQEIWFTDHGALRGDEINILKAGANYGWPIKTTGKYRDSTYQAPELNLQDYEAPFWFWSETVAPTGLIFYTGEVVPPLKDHLLVAGLSEGSLWSITFRNGRALRAENLIRDNPVRLRKVAQSPKGQLYVLTDEWEGKILRLEY